MESLVNSGFRTDMAVRMTDTITKLRLLCKYYYSAGDEYDVREHEARSFLVLPLLYALGWTEQQLKIEYKLPAANGEVADIAGFSDPYRSSQHKGHHVDPRLIVETKALALGPMEAIPQVERYAVNVMGDKIVAATNGLWWLVGEMRNGDTHMRNKAYLNIIDPRTRYPLDPSNIEGCIEALELLRCH